MEDKSKKYYLCNFKNQEAQISDLVCPGCTNRVECAESLEESRREVMAYLRDKIRKAQS